MLLRVMLSNHDKERSAFHDIVAALFRVKGALIEQEHEAISVAFVPFHELHQALCSNSQRLGPHMFAVMEGLMGKAMQRALERQRRLQRVAPARLGLPSEWTVLPEASELLKDLHTFSAFLTDHPDSRMVWPDEAPLDDQMQMLSSMSHAMRCGSGPAGEMPHLAAFAGRFLVERFNKLL